MTCPTPSARGGLQAWWRAPRSGACAIRRRLATAAGSLPSATSAASKASSRSGAIVPTTRASTRAGSSQAWREANRERHNLFERGERGSRGKSPRLRLRSRHRNPPRRAKLIEGQRSELVRASADVNLAGAFADLRRKLAPTSSIRTQSAYFCRTGEVRAGRRQGIAFHQGPLLVPSSLRQPAGTFAFTGS